MAYVKPQRLIQDSGIGFEDVNQAFDNEAATRSIWDAEHGANDTISIVQPPVTTLTQGWGTHDSVKIPRDVGAIAVAPYPLSTVVSNITFDFWLRGKLMLEVTRSLTGLYFIRTGPLDANTAWMVVTPVATSTQVRFAMTRYQAGSIAQPSGFYIHLVELDSGVFAAADYSFAVAIFSA